MMKGDKRSIRQPEGCREGLEDAMMTMEQGRQINEEAGKRGDKHLEMLGEKVAKDERDAKRGRRAEKLEQQLRQAENHE